MPRGIRNPSPVVIPVPAPLIIIQPSQDAAQFTAIGLTAVEAIDQLRRILLHFAATQSGVSILNETIAHNLAVAPPALPTRSNGIDPQKRSPKRRQPQPTHHDDWEDDTE